MVFESIWLATWSAMRVGMFALMSPVMTFTDGRWVERRRCMPTARDICARRTMQASSSRGYICMMSASSSMTMTMYGIASGISFAPFFFAGSNVFLWYVSISRARSASSTLYLRSISLAAHLRAMMAFLGSVITGVRRCGMPLYIVNSTRFGSIMMNRSAFGPLLYSSEVMMACMATLFPLPVAPAMRP